MLIRTPRRQQFPLNNSHCVLNARMDGNGNDKGRGANCPHPVTESFVFWDTITKKFGSASGDFEGASRYLSYDDSVDWNWPEVFSISGWIYVDAYRTGKVQTIASQWTSNSDGWHIYQTYISATEQYIRFYNYTTGEVLLGTTAAANYVADTWYHLAFWRWNGTYRYSMGGIIKETNTVAVSTTATAAPMKLGNTDRGLTDMYWPGFLDDFVFTKGYSPFTNRNFTPPNRQA